MNFYISFKKKKQFGLNPFFNELSKNVSKLGVPIKTTVSANVLEEAMNGTVTVRPLPIGTSVSGKVWT